MSISALDDMSIGKFDFREGHFVWFVIVIVWLRILFGRLFHLFPQHFCFD